jgi:hypothetical protein
VIGTARLNHRSCSISGSSTGSTKDPEHVRPRNERARHPSSPRRNLRVSVDADLISRVTDSDDELKAWQHRPLDALVVYLDALVVKIRDKGVVQNKAVYIAVGVGMDGGKDVLGMWIQQTEGAKFWLSILTS